MRLKGWSGGKQAARESRKAMSPPELRLWLELRMEPGGYYFRRQHRAGPYRLDFYCAKAKLCVEVDSEAHERGDQPERDARRDAWLLERGVATLRIPAVEVMRNLDGVLQHILATVAARGDAPSVSFAACEVGSSPGRSSNMRGMFDLARSPASRGRNEG